MTYHHSTPSGFIVFLKTRRLYRCSYTVLHTTQRKKKKEKKATLGVSDTIASFFILLLKALDMREAKRCSRASRIPEKQKPKQNQKTVTLENTKQKWKQKHRQNASLFPKETLNKWYNLEFSNPRTRYNWGKYLSLSLSLPLPLPQSSISALNAFDVRFVCIKVLTVV